MNRWPALQTCWPDKYIYIYTYIQILYQAFGHGYMLMRSVLNHNLSTISFMQNYLALFEICIVVCCGLFKCIFFSGLELWSSYLWFSTLWIALLLFFHMAGRWFCGYSFFVPLHLSNLYIVSVRYALISIENTSIQDKKLRIRIILHLMETFLCPRGEYKISVVGLTHFFSESCQQHTQTHR